ncbi:MAG: tRNA (cytidine(34)-2'-O)-methyltransferase [Eubacterium sp.]|nr:tRNA (cytidine(34)-2'-O)-methyltransferase [Eubacterium sp.]
MNIVLHEPEIPYNTGNIGRTCVITGAALHLIRPYGFMINSKMIKRAGLDYWDRLKLHEHDNIEAFYKFISQTENKFINESAQEIKKESNIGLKTVSIENNCPRIFYATTKGKHRYTDVEYRDGDYIMFGSEGSGIPEEILAKNPDNCIRIPMNPLERSLNLSNSVAIILYEALRQLDFPNLESEGDLHRLKYIK